MSIASIISRTAAVTAGTVGIIGLALTGAASASTVSPAGNPTVGPQTCSIQTVNGHYLTAVGGGGLFDNDPNHSVIHSDAPWIRAWEEFTLVPLNNGKTFAYAIRTINGYYLTAINGGGQAGGGGQIGTHLVIESNATGVTTWEQFQVICGL